MTACFSAQESAHLYAQEFQHLHLYQQEFQHQPPQPMLLTLQAVTLQAAQVQLSRAANQDHHQLLSG